MCDTMAIVKGDRTLFAKNSDREHDEPQILEYIPAGEHGEDSQLAMTHLRIPQVRHTNSVLISRPYWIWGAEIGSNDHGLTVGNEALFSVVPASAAPGIIGMDYIRLALERAASIEEGVSVITTLLEQYGQHGNCSATGEVAYHNSYLLADSHGALILETIDRDWVIRRVAKHDAISNAITSGKDYVGANKAMIDIDTGANIDFRRTFHDPKMGASPDFRRGRMMDLLASVGEAECTSLFDILRDHLPGPTMPDRAPPRICAHAEKASLGQTTGSWVADLSDEINIHWVTGTSAPCTSVFKPLLVGAPLPPHGPRPSYSPDPSSLWWRHEKLRRALLDADVPVRTTFEMERDALEKDFVEAIDLDRSRGSPESMQQTINSCWTRAHAFEERWSIMFGQSDFVHSEVRARR